MTEPKNDVIGAGLPTTAINIFEGLGNAVKKREILCTSAFEL